MKKLFLTISILLSVSSLKAQTTGGTDFWLTFGINAYLTTEDVYLQIRIVNGNMDNDVSITFTGLPATFTYHLLPQEVKTIDLLPGQKDAVYSATMGKSNKSVRITADLPVTAYAVNLCANTTVVGNAG